MEDLYARVMFGFYGGFALVLAVGVGYVLYKRARYLGSGYYAQCGRGFLEVLRDRGAWFEYLVGCEVLRNFEGSRVLWNVYVPKAKGGTSECDVVAMVGGRLFVFECKGYSGWIYGRENDYKWTQVLNPASKYRFYNPVKQNAAHVRALAGHLGIEVDGVVSLVVFSNACELKRVTVTGAVPVCRRRDMTGHVRRILKAEGVTFGPEVFDRLVPLVHASEAERQAHVDRIKQRYGKC